MKRSKNRLLSAILVMCMMISMLSGVSLTAFAEGPINISSVDDLEALRDAVNNGETYAGKTVTLTENLDLGTIPNWTPIGTSSNPFEGIFDGDSHIIYNLTIDTDVRYCGLFGYVSGGAIKNLGLENVKVTSTANDVAGLTGFAGYGSTIERCYATGVVTGYAAVSGIAGSTYGNVSTVRNTYARVQINRTSTRGDSAGISGWNESGSVKIENCYSACTGEVRPIAGWSDGAAVPNGQIINTYFDQTLSPDFSASSGRVDLGRTSEQLKTKTTYEGWDFESVWTIDESINGGYPYLQGFTPGLGGAPGSISVAVKDADDNPVTDADVYITNGTDNIPLNHQGDGIYSGTVETNGETYELYVNDKEMGSFTQNGSGALTIPSITIEAAATQPTKVGPFIVSGGVEGQDYKYTEVFDDEHNVYDNVLTVLTNIPLSITASSTVTTARIAVADGVNANITLDNLKIDLKNHNGSALAVPNGASLKLTVAGDNLLRSYAAGPGILVDNGADLEINGTDTDILEVYGSQLYSYTDQGGTSGGYATGFAGIGGPNSGSAYNYTGKITINGGTITAHGFGYGAGIGGGDYGSGGIITINGGIITATTGEGLPNGWIDSSTANASGIGASQGQPGGTILITGGTVKASGGYGCAGIGGGTADVTITGGDVTAYGGPKAAGIGGYDQNKGNIKITIGANATVTAYGGSGGCGLGQGSNKTAPTTLNVEKGAKVIAFSKENSNRPAVTAVANSAENSANMVNAYITNMTLPFDVPITAVLGDETVNLTVPAGTGGVAFTTEAAGEFIAKTSAAVGNVIYRFIPEDKSKVTITSSAMFGMENVVAVSAESLNVAELTIGESKTSYETFAEAWKTGVDSAQPFTLKLLADVKSSDYKGKITDFYGTISVKNISATLDLNGFTLLQDTENKYSIFSLSDASDFTIEDTSNEKTGKITSNFTYGDRDVGGQEPGNGLVNILYEDSKLTLNGGTVSGIQTAEGKIYCAVNVNKGTFVMNGGKIANNACTGVVVRNGGKFTMNGGEISKNTSNGMGGGVLSRWGVVEINDGAKITGNKALYPYWGREGNGAGGGIAEITSGTTGDGLSEAASGVILSGSIDISGNFGADNQADDIAVIGLETYQDAAAYKSYAVTVQEDFSAVNKIAIRKLNTGSAIVVHAGNKSQTENFYPGHPDYTFGMFENNSLYLTKSIKTSQVTAKVQIEGAERQLSYTESDYTQIPYNTVREVIPVTAFDSPDFTFLYQNESGNVIGAFPTDIGKYNVEISYIYYNLKNGSVYENSRTFYFEIVKADPTYIVPTGLTATYGDVLASVMLPDDWTWKDSTQSVGNAGNNTFKAKFTPDDTEHYNIITDIDVSVAVSKANPVYTVPTGLTATYGDTLTNVTLPIGWTWADNTQNVGSVGNHTFKAAFTPADTNNYNLVTDVDISVAVNKRPVNIIWSSTENFVYDGTEKTISAEIENLVSGDTANLTLDGIVKATEKGSYTATVTAVDNSNYTLEGGTNLEKNWSISETENKWTQELTITGWAYGEAANAPQATSKFGTVVFSYSESENGEYTENIPQNAGTYWVMAAVPGTISYAELSAKKEFVIAKANPVIEEAPEATRVRRDYELSNSTLSGGIVKGVNDTVLEGLFAWKDGTEVMNETGEFTKTVVFTPVDGNYVPVEIEITVTVYRPSGGGTTTTRYTVTFDTQGASKISSSTVTRNTVVKEPAEPTKNGYVFSGWFTDKECTEEYDFTAKVTKNITLYAKWTEDKKEPSEPTDPTKPTDPTEPEKWKNPFTDVKEDDWFYHAVQYASENGLFSGVTETAFAPDEAITRGMLVTVLWRMENKPVVNYLMTFADIDGSAYYAEAVRWAASNGIVKGYSDTEFAPDKLVSREEIAAIMQRYVDFKGMDTTAKADLSKFTDHAAVSEWAKGNVQWAVGSGLISGEDNNRIDPLGSATRAETAAILQRFLEKTIK